MRARLNEHLGRLGRGGVAVVSAPAGFGKTTTVAAWLESLPPDGQRVAWLSLDERDDDPATFWSYVAAALATAAGGELSSSLAALGQSARPPLDALVATLLNGLLDSDSDVILVLDDYHAIASAEVHQSVALFLERLPLQARVIIATRADPPLPLARLRVGGRLVEVRAGDLRFTAAETAAYFERVADAPLSSTDVRALAERTEGWVAALQLAALSMRGRNDVSSFITAFAGDDRFIVDYLAEEVLDRQPDDVRQFLLRSSILDRLSGPLCDAVTGQRGGRAMLERLERANMFLVPLDDRRQWYRYHHLFAAVLQAHLADEQPEAIAALHQRAGAWFAANGDPAEGVRHAFAAGDVELAADLAEVAVPAWRRDRQEATIRNWLQRLPDEVLRKRPVLTIDLIGARASIGEFAADCATRLDEVERLIQPADGGAAPPAPMIVRRTEQLPSLPAAIELYRAALALRRGDLEATRRHGGRAIERAPHDEHLVRAAGAALVGLAAWTSGDLDAACATYTTSIEGLCRAGHLSDALGCSITLADLRLAQGRLRDAEQVYRDGLALSAGHGGPPLRGTADMHVGLSDIHRQRDELAAALDQLQRSAELGEHNGLPQHPYRWRLATARLHVASGDLDAARQLLDEAEAVYTTDFSPAVQPIPAVRAGLLADAGLLDEAEGWVRQRGLSADDEFDYVGTFEHLTLARVLLARFRTRRSSTDLDAALRLTQRLAADATDGERHGDLLQVLVLQALAEEAGGARSAAVAHLTRAVTLAEPEGYVRLFRDEGPRLRPLLDAVAARGVATSYIARLLGADAPPSRPIAAQGARQPLVDPLSERELDVLRLLRSELNGPEIARHLTVSLNTIRSHTKSIYSKLGVSNRRAAVRRAEELGLLTPTG